MMIDRRSKREIGILRRIVFAMTTEELEQLSGKFIAQEEYIENGDQEILDYIAWVQHRQQMLS